ncbi:hypothetical protein JQS43_24435 [Natronosporangium hydrolyticum]|uniref:Uncharacterized protein n=1 Tax=Natronosporangium hydrolyticum TaxID=2811111 RepID=A0A895YGR0_9ACTN|nr:hypothetical protein [Natronosporangium hydrolyticum]QSB14583.1 hypothetical protein JQS43_24435 [Natronosporangium hydrolyticum]
MKVRIMGTPAECQAAVTALAASPRLSVVEVSNPYPNRGDSRQVRVYVEAHPAKRGGRDDHQG